jgi:hypothetical protein
MYPKPTGPPVKSNLCLKYSHPDPSQRISSLDTGLLLGFSPPHFAKTPALEPLPDLVARDH